MIEHKVDNALVDMKDEIISRIDGGSLSALECEMEFLSRIMPLWAAMDYAYKGVELSRRIYNRAADLQYEEDNYLQREIIGDLFSSHLLRVSLVMIKDKHA